EAVPKVPGRRWDTGPVLERRDLDEPEACEEVDEVGVIDDDLGPAHGGHQLLPASHLLIELGQEDLTVAREGRAVLGLNACEAIDDVLGDDRGQTGIE